MQATPSRTTTPEELANIAGRLERLPMTNYQRKLFAVVATAWLADQVDVALLAFLLPSLIVDFKLSAAQAGLLASMTFAGQLVGNIVAGTLSDRYGRKPLFQATMIVWGAGSLLAALATSLPMLMFFRFIIGAGVGGEAPVAQAMLTELLPAKVRGKYIAFMEGFWAVGYVISGTISFFFLGQLHLGWRPVFIVVGCFALFVYVARRMLPESPRWLADNGRLPEAEAVTATIEAQVAAQTRAPLAAPQRYRLTVVHHAQNAVAVLFEPAYRMRTTMAFGMWFFALLGFFGLTSWVSQFLTAAGFPIAKSVGFTTLISLGGIPGFYVAAVMLERVGRKPTTAACLLIGAASAFWYGHQSTQVMLFITGFVMNFFLFGMWSCLYAYTPELFPTHARATGAGFASAFGRIGAISGPIIGGYVVASIGVSGFFTLGAASFVISAVLVLTLGIETRGQVIEVLAS